MFYFINSHLKFFLQVFSSLLFILPQLREWWWWCFRLVKPGTRVTMEALSLLHAFAILLPRCVCVRVFYVYVCVCVYVCVWLHSMWMPPYSSQTFNTFPAERRRRRRNVSVSGPNRSRCSLTWRGIAGQRSSSFFHGYRGGPGGGNSSKVRLLSNFARPASQQRTRPKTSGVARAAPMLANEAI